MKITYPITSESWPAIIEQLNLACSDGGKEVIIQPVSKKRSLDANALYHKFCSLIASRFGHDVKTVTSECKRDFGVPVLLEADDDRSTRLKWTLNKIGYWDMSPSQQIKVMDMFSITSVMTTKEMSKVITFMQAHYREHGLHLESNRNG